MQGLKALGFDQVIATPHMRPGLFDNTAEAIREAYALAKQATCETLDLPDTALSAEHYFDDVVFERLLTGGALPYPGGRAVLLEFYEIDFPYTIDHRLADLRRRGLLPVIAHPERYHPIARSIELLERLLDVGAAALLDVAALCGKYGRHASTTARELLRRGLYHAACTDVHRPTDLGAVERAMGWVAREYGEEELELLFSEGPRALLEGRLLGEPSG